MKVRAVQFSPVLGDVKRNLEYHRQAVEEAVTAGAELAVFPELSLSGYHLKDIVFDAVLSPISPEIKMLKEWSRRISLVVGAPMELTPGIIHNCALCFDAGELLHIHKKTQLPNFGMFEERMIFRHGSSFIPFRFKGFKAGLLICREILFPVLAWLYFLQGTNLLIGISNSPFRSPAGERFASFDFWENMGYVFSQFYHQNYLFVNRTGFEDGIGFGGGSFYAAAGSGITAMAPYFDAAVLDVIINSEESRRARLSANYLRDECPDMIFKELERIIHAGVESSTD